MRDSGIGEVVIHPAENGAAGNAQSNRERLKWARDSLLRLAEHADAAGVRIAVENGQGKATPTASVAALLELIDGIGGHLGVCLDVGHSVLSGFDPVDETRVALASGRLFSLHLHDITADGTDHVLLPPGHGRVDLQAILAELDSADFHGILTVELRPLPEDIAPRLQQAAACREAWKGREQRA